MSGLLVQLMSHEDTISSSHYITNIKKTSLVLLALSNRSTLRKTLEEKKGKDFADSVMYQMKGDDVDLEPLYCLTR